MAKESLSRYAPAPWGMQPNTSPAALSPQFPWAAFHSCLYIYCILYHFWDVRRILLTPMRQFRRELSNHLSSFHSQLKPSIVQTFSSPSFPSQFFQSMFLDPPSLYFLHPPPSHRTRIFNPFPKWCSGLIAIIAITYLHPTLALACADQA